jgi:hypothetical protein
VKHAHFSSVLALLLLAFPAYAQRPASVDVDKLIHAAQENGEAMSKRVFDYSWKSKTLVRNFKRSRVLNEVEQDHEVYPAPGLTYVAQKLVKENGLPLSPKRAAKEEQRLNKELLNAELQQAIFHLAAPVSESTSGCINFGIWTVLNGPGGKETSLGISDFLCFATFFAPRIERKGDRETAVLLFRPNEKMTTPAQEKTPFAKLVGTIWIDLKDRVVTHVEAWPNDNPSTFNSLPTTAPPIVFDDMRLPDGMWVRRLRYIDTRKDTVAFNGLNLEWKQEFSGYQRYYTELKDFQVEESKKKIGDKPPEP